MAPVSRHWVHTDQEFRLRRLLISNQSRDPGTLAFYYFHQLSCGTSPRLLEVRQSQCVDPGDDPHQRLTRATWNEIHAVWAFAIIAAVNVNCNIETINDDNFLSVILSDVYQILRNNDKHLFMKTIIK